MLSRSSTRAIFPTISWADPDERGTSEAQHIEQLRDAITATVVYPTSRCADHQRRGLQRIAAVPFVTMCNLANLNAAMGGGLLDLIEVHLMCVGAGPTLDFADAAAFLAGFETMIEKVRRRRLQ